MGGNIWARHTHCEFKQHGSKATLIHEHFILVALMGLLPDFIKELLKY